MEMEDLLASAKVKALAEGS